MVRREINQTDIKAFSGLRLRTSGAYEGTVTSPGDLISDGKIIFSMRAVPETNRDLAIRLSEKRKPEAKPVSQNQAGDVFQKVRKRASKKARLLGRVEDPSWILSLQRDSIAVLRYGRGRSTRYVVVDAHRLLLLEKMVAFDEILCERPSAPVLLRRKGKPVGVLTAFQVEVDVKT